MYHIYSIKRHGVYLIFRDSSAAFIRGKRLYEGGVHLKFNLFLVNNSMVTEHLNLKKKTETCFSACLKSQFQYLKTLLQSRKIFFLACSSLIITAFAFRVCYSNECCIIMMQRLFEGDVY